MLVGVDVGVSVGITKNGVSVGTTAFVGVGVGVLVAVDVGVAVGVDVLVGIVVAVGVEVGVLVGADVFVGVLVARLTGVLVAVFVGVAVGRAVLVGVAVASDEDVWITSCGQDDVASRLLKVSVEPLVVVTAKSYQPGPVIIEVTSTPMYVEDLNAPEEPISAPSAGALLYVTCASSQLLDATPCT